ncbi:M23 family metallopeptidase [Solicola sp. PLA-1-18]|uniref:M23 family metallopeptidase n=1 Tax=Solicola sp. PLA-1-18 TaxID=3380532 RepID=UPI003B7834CB
MARHFPLGRPRSWFVVRDGSVHRGQALLALLVTCGLVLAIASPGSADDQKDKVRKKQQDVAGQIGGAKASLDQSSKQYSQAAAALEAAQTSLSTARSRLTTTRGQLATAKAQDTAMQAKLTQAEGQLDGARTALKKGRKKLKRAESDVKEFTLESLQNGDPSLRAFSGLLRGEAPSKFTEQMVLSGSVGDAQLAQMDTFDASRVMLTLNEEKVEKLRDSVKAQRKAAAENLATKERLEAEQAAQTAKVTQLVGTASKAETAAAALKQDDLAELGRLESERSRLGNKLKAIAARERAAEKRRHAAAAAKKRKQSSGGGGSSSAPEPEEDTGGAGDAADGGGTLSRPVDGPITSRYGMRFHPVLKVWKLHDGTDFGVPCGTPVRAAAGGRVIEKYFNAGYGNRIILANGQMRGKSIATTYNHLSRFKVRVGQKVKRGQVIAYSGTTGYSTGCHLHFMVLEDGDTVNPMGWL